MDVVVALDVQWIGFGVTVAIPDGSDVSFQGAERWDALALPGVTWFLFGPELLDVDEPLFNLDPYEQAYDFGTFINPPNGPPWAPPGEYTVGSVTIDTSLLLGSATIETFFTPGLDGLGIDDGTGNIVFSEDADFFNASLGTAQLVVIPEPATGGLAAGGLRVLGLLGRRLRASAG